MFDFDPSTASREELIERVKSLSAYIEMQDAERSIQIEKGVNDEISNAVKKASIEGYRRGREDAEGLYGRTVNMDTIRGLIEKNMETLAEN